MSVFGKAQVMHTDCRLAPDGSIFSTYQHLTFLQTTEPEIIVIIVQLNSTKDGQQFFSSSKGDHFLQP
jgi:hypothetical protein